MARVGLHLIVYALLAGSIFFGLVTTASCFQVNKGVAETNILYRLVGFWSFPIVLLLDTLFVLIAEWLRKYVRWSPIILFTLIAA